MDYSKWDNFGADEDISDDEKHISVEMVANDQSVEINRAGYKLIDNHNQNQISTKIVLPKRKEGVIDESFLCSNGDSLRNFFWRQDSQKVVVSMVLADNICAKNLKVLLCAGKTLKIICGDSILLEGDLRYKINTDGEQTSSKFKNCFELSDWDIQTMYLANPLSSDQKFDEPLRIFQLTLEKQSPLPGVVFWWSNLFMGDKEIDVTNIHGRKNNSNRSSQLQDEDPYAQAQKLFTERIKNKQKIEVDF